jgi:hypothetical protein
MKYGIFGKSQREKIRKGLNQYKVYKAFLTQTTTDAPVATILENTLGDIVWTRGNTGQYVGTLAGAFPGGKTFCLKLNGSDCKAVSNTFTFGRTGDNAVYINSFNGVYTTASDSILENTQIEIQVYE